MDEKKGTILIVDDQLNNLKVISELLSNNYKVYTSTSGINAFQILEKVKIDIILLDIIMPDMDGFDVCQRLKKNTSTCDIPIIFLTAKNSTEDIIKGLTLGAVDYIKKPFHSKEVKVRIETHLQLKKTKEELKLANSHLKELNAIKDKFISIISHDLKNPIGAVSNLSKILISDLDSIDKEKMLKMLGLINQSSENTFKLLDNLLTWSRAQTGKIKINRTKIHLNDLLQYAIDFCQSLAVNKDIKIINDSNLSLEIWADMDMINTVLRNLITNAIKFTNRNGFVRIQSKNHNNAITISVVDTGVGMSQDTLNDLFQTEKKTSTTGTEKEEGTGLGLLISKEFIGKHGGEIWAESQEGVGSKFHFTLPINQSKG